MRATWTARQKIRQSNKSVSAFGPGHMHWFSESLALAFCIAEFDTTRVLVDRLSGLITANVVM